MRLARLKAGPALPIMEGMRPSALRRAAAGALLLTSLAIAGFATTASAAKLRPVSALGAAEVGTDSITLRWKDRSRGESFYEVQTRPGGGEAGWRTSKAKRNRGRLIIRRLERGTAYESRVRACKRGRCAPWGRKVRSATLLAPFNGPHPDPGCATFPASDEFNRDVSSAPLDPRSDQIIGRINADGGDSLHPDFGSNPDYGIPFVVVPAAQPLVPIDFAAYGDESDAGPYPIPPGAPVEGGAGSDGDRHVLAVRRPSSPGGPCGLFELYRSFEDGGARGGWTADSGSIFDLGSPLAGQRPDGWTSADAAGLPIYPGLVTYEEVETGEIDHAIRITFEETRKGYISPATHYASSSCDPYRPSMGMRLRLRSGYDISGLGTDSRVIATALQRYGAIVADNGSNWFISGSTDRRWDDEDLNGLKGIPGSAFEVVGGGAETTPC